MGSPLMVYAAILRALPLLELTDSFPAKHSSLESVFTQYVCVAFRVKRHLALVSARRLLERSSSSLCSTDDGLHVELVFDDILQGLLVQNNAITADNEDRVVIVGCLSGCSVPFNLCGKETNVR